LGWTGNSGVTTALALLALGTAGSWAETKIARADLPSMVEKAVAEASKGATIRGLSREVKGGKTFYEAELTVNGHERDLRIDESGKVVDVEEELPLASLPSAAQEGLKKAAGAVEIVKVESLTKAGKLVAYEAVVKAAGKTTEVQVDPNGSRLKP
jgi:uncharacterized membrane protein YkoI